MSWETRLQQLLQEKAQQQLLRTRQITSNTLQFGSNDYLGLAVNSRVRSFFQEGFARYPAGSGGSPMLSGYHMPHRMLEDTVATLHAAEAAVYFSCGYTANLALGMLSGALKASVVIDKAVHASVYDGLRIANIPYKRYMQQHLSSLEDALQSVSKPAIVLTEGMFSMSGAIAPLSEILALCAQYDAVCLLDEAHSFGLIGPQGLGLAHSCALSYDQIPLRMLAFGKAAGVHGAALVGKKIWIDTLLQYARSYIYSTAPPPAMAFGLEKTIRYLAAADQERARLYQIVAYFRQRVQSMDLKLPDAPLAIQRYYTKDADAALRLSEMLAGVGIGCKAVRPPTVPLRETGLRIVLTALHTEQEVDYLLENIQHYQ